MKKTFSGTGVLFILIAAFTAIVSFVDVRPIGPQETEVGLATLNQFVFQHIGVHLLRYTITDQLF